MQRPIIERVFARSALRALGVEMPSVPTGDMLNYVVTAGAPGSFADGVAAVDASAYTLSPFELQPRRLSAGYLIKEEDVMRVKRLRARVEVRPSTRALSNRLDAQALGVGNSTVRGFLATAANGGLAARAAPSDTVTYLLALAESSLGVDGIYAGSCNGAGVGGGRRHVPQAGRASQHGKSGQIVRCNMRTQVLRRLRSSANIPAVASNVQEGIVAKMGQGMSHATAPVWGGGPRIIRDEVTKANTGTGSFHRARVLQLPRAAADCVPANVAQGDLVLSLGLHESVEARSTSNADVALLQALEGGPVAGPLSTSLSFELLAVVAEAAGVWARRMALANVDPDPMAS